ncbi:MAG TPA: PQQ-dependent dehydrogenase, methanol/ethanol family [Candidatus Sulfotelmatobacter sp.]|nr:PQQ-dependent dehydrogenase, methanol/ethanol family [Candidatus Sulfotelmatobacter sp.]
MTSCEKARMLLLLVAVCALPGLPTAAAQGKSPLTAVSSVGAEDLLARPVGVNWTSYHGDYTGRRYSSLHEINAANVSQLRAAWVFHPGNSQRLEATPVVIRGIMYVTSANDAFALDARTGRVLWHYQRPVSLGLLDDAAAHKSRGVAVWQNFVYMETDDAHLLCLDARSGGLRWDIQYADKAKHYGATSAPLVVKDEVIVGTSGGDSGVRGFLAAYDAQTGKPKWSLWTIPAPGEFGSSSWPGDSYLHGGGTTWMPGTYDPELDTLYWTTSNAAPDFAGASRPGDDLYTACVLAIDPNTGKLRWYFQFTPHDLYDYDANETPVLLDLDENGVARRLLVQADRNGFLYVLDRTNGKFLNAAPFVEKLNWAKGVDPSGRPILSGRIPTAAGTYICPGINGATNWFSPSYNPDAKLFYVMALESCNVFFANPKPFAQGETYYGTGTKLPPDEHAQKILVALSLPDGKAVWRCPQAGQGDSWGGTLTTAGGLVFFGDDTGSLEAVDAGTGRALWHFNTGQTMHASPMTYAVDGVQYVALSVESDVFSFALPH